LYKVYPFKFNAHWLNDHDFVDLVYKIWKDPFSFPKVENKTRIVWKLKVLKKQTKIWYKENLARNKAKLVSLESDIKDSIIILVGDPTNQEAELSLRQMELERNNILRRDEEQWRLRSRAIWMASGDNNTSIFTNFLATIESETCMGDHRWKWS
jgi:hypothetical protein